jgi:hypothetical protein
VRTPGKITAALLGTIAATVVVPASAGALTLGSVTTKSVEDITARTATLRAEATVSLLGATINWQYGPTTTYGLTSGNVLTSLIGIKETVSLPLTGLLPGTTYHVRAVANGGLDTVLGRDVTFKTADERTGDDSGGGTTVTVTVPGVGTTTTTTNGTTTTTPATPTTTPGKDDSSSSSSSNGKGKGGDSSSSSGSTVVTDDPATAITTDPAASIPAGQATAAITPVLGKTLAIAAVQGTVTATSPTGAPVDLSDARAVPTGTVIDARGGTVELTTALAKPGTTQTGRFWGGQFEVRQTAGDRGLTQLLLRGVDWRTCSAAAARRAVVRRAFVQRAAKGKSTKKRKPARTLWGSDDHGKFQTRGRGSVATVRGTRWMTQDTCEGTTTRVADGAVEVRDFGANRTVVVRKGGEYQARVAP